MCLNVRGRQAFVADALLGLAGAVFAMQRLHWLCSSSVQSCTRLALLKGIAHAELSTVSPTWCPVWQVSGEASFIAQRYDIHIEVTLACFSSRCFAGSCQLMLNSGSTADAGSGVGTAAPISHTCHLHHWPSLLGIGACIHHKQ